MYTRPFSTVDAQFGSHEWLMKRARLPRCDASMTTREFTVKK